MKAIVISEHGGTDCLVEGEVSPPTIGPDEVLIRVACVGMNHLDLWVRKGVPGHKFPLPMIPGCDLAGTIEEVGESVSGFSRGDRVAIAPGFADPSSRESRMGLDHLARDYGVFGETRNGGCAQFVDVPARNLLPIPDDMSFEDAAAFPLAFLTAWGMLVRRAEIRQGESILVHAAGSGVSVACIQIAKLFHAGPVIATAGSEEKLAKARKLGVDIAINYKTQNFLEEVRRATSKAGVNIVVDHVGPSTIEDSLACMAKGGRLVTCGSTSGGSAEINLRRVFFKSLSILGSTMGSLGDMLQVWDLHCSGDLSPVVDRVFPIGDIAKAHDYLEARKAFGKVVLDLQNW